MISDTERREVARRLRERAGKRVLNLGELLWCIGCDDGDDAAAWNRLADLIEPDTTGDTTKTASDTTKCDREALLALADGLEADADRIIKAAKNARFGVGPRMGEAEHDVAEWRSIARRIREACGVDDAD